MTERGAEGCGFGHQAGSRADRSIPGRCGRGWSGRYAPTTSPTGVPAGAECRAAAARTRYETAPCLDQRVCRTTAGHDSPGTLARGLSTTLLHQAGGSVASPLPTTPNARIRVIACAGALGPRWSGAWRRRSDFIPHHSGTAKSVNTVPTLDRLRCFSSSTGTRGGRVPRQHFHDVAVHDPEHALFAAEPQ